MTYPKIPLAQTVIQLCKSKEVKHIIISPGSRNAPLTIGFTNDAYFKCYSIVDERCAAFFALGIAQQTKSPVAVICTSGSALLNYYPAVAEAFYSDIPLIVLSADRPNHLIGIGDGQTINQKDVYSNHILYSANLKQELLIENAPESLLESQNIIQQENETEINKVINIAIADNGPVHINVPFNEPLYELTKVLTVNPSLISRDKHTDNLNTETLQELTDTWNKANRKMVLVGVNQPNTIEQQWLDLLATDESVLVFTETTSNLHHSNFFPSIDKIIAPLAQEEFKDLQPEILLTFGGMVVSKKVKAFLRENKPKQHWHIDEKKANDTFFSLTKHIRSNPNRFLSQFLPKITALKSDYLSLWASIRNKRTERHSTYLDQIPFCDFKAFDLVLKTLPDTSILQLGNSSTIRYTQLFDLNKTLSVFCNRGTSGIDGSTSTAIGCAVTNSKQTTLITGDLSFFYDSNALWNDYIPNNFRIIVINNEGGGIFRILPGHKNTENFDTYFETKHQLNAKQLCEMYQFEYVSVSSEAALSLTISSFYSESEQPKVLEIFTPRTVNDEVLLDYFKFIK